MNTVLFYAKTKEEALGCINDICTDIKNLPPQVIPDGYKLFFRRIFMLSYTIYIGKLDGTPCDKEILIFPQADDIRLHKLQEEKKVVLYKNCMYVVGDSNETKKRRHNLIFWLLGLTDLEVDT